MAAGERITVDKSYFDALLRRADFHTSAHILGRQDPASVTISKVEYESLLRSSREYEMLKASLFEGGLTSDTLALLITGNGHGHGSGNTASGALSAKDPLPSVTAWADDFEDTPPSYSQPSFRQSAPDSGASWRTGASAPSSNPPHGFGAFSSGDRRPSVPTNSHPHVSQRVVSYGMTPSSVPDDAGFDEADSFLDDGNELETATGPNGLALRTLYFSGFHPRTTYRDLLSVIKGGKLLSINMRSEKSATVTFLDAAADYLAYVKRNDIYLHAKRIDVKWAERQFQLNNHINNKIVNGATRNILIRSAVEKGLTEFVIRDDMEHVHGLVIIDIVYRSGHAYVSCNSIHTALFARTCMMSRKEYRGCKIEFFADECDVPLPARAFVPKPVPQEPVANKFPVANRFHMLNVDDTDSSSNEENHAPYDSAHSDDDDDDDTIDLRGRHGVRLDFLESESTV